MSSKLKISIIIPVYNAKLYIRECLDSVLSQTYRNMEVIVVDDGATDGSGKICDDYADRDSRFLILHTENTGAGAARNTAMNKMTGDYCMFIDSDDYWLDKNIVHDIVVLLEESKADVLSFERREFFSEEKRPVFDDGNLPRGEVFGKRNDLALKALLSKPPAVFSSSLITKVVSTKFIKDNGISLLENILGEDVYYTAQVIVCSGSYDRYNKVAYAVRRSDRNTRTLQKSAEIKHKCLRDMITVFGEVFKYVEKKETLEENPLLYKQLMNFLSSPFVYALGMAAGALEYCKSDEEKKEIQSDIAKMKQYSHTTKYAGRFSVRLVGLFISIFGISATVAALRLFLKIYKRDKLSI